MVAGSVRAALARGLLMLALARGAGAELRPAGTEFWFAWPRCPDVTVSDPDYDLDGELVVLTDSAVPVSFTVTGPAGFSVNGVARDVAPGRIQIPRTAMMTTDRVVEAKGLHVTTRGCGQVAALFRVPGSNSSVGDEVMTLLPSTALGTEYWPDTYPGQAELVVVAIEDGTRVRWENPHCPGPVDLVLDAGEAVQHLCDDDVAGLVQRGIGGTHVVADKPVAVVVGATANVVRYLIPSFPTPLMITWCCADVLMEQMRPVSDWEREVRLAPFMNTGSPVAGDVVRIAVACPDTEVVVEDGVRVRRRTLQPGETWELTELVGTDLDLVRTPITIRGTRPIQVSQLSIGWQVAGMGDPSQAIVPGLLRPAGSHRFLVPEQSQGWANLIVPASAAGSVALDGVTIPAAQWSSHVDGQYAWKRVGPLLPGQHVVTGTGDPMAVTAYGYVLDDAGVPFAGAYSYAAPSFGGGSEFPVLVQAGDRCAPHCPGDCVLLDAGPGYRSHEWSTAETTRTIVACPGSTALLTVTVTDANGCSGTGLVDLPVLPPPVPDIAGPLVACEGDCVTLSIPPGFATVSWTGGPTTDSVSVCPTAPVTPVEVVVTDGTGCEGRDRVEVALLRRPALADLAAADGSPCDRGVALTWPDATWPNDPPTGTYAVYRSTTDCASALADPPIASGLIAPGFLDTTAAAGVPHAYAVVAEDDTTATGCGDGPDHGGLATVLCVTGVLDALDRTPPASDAMASLRIGHQSDVVVARWDAAPALDRGQLEHVHLLRAEAPLGPFTRITPEDFVATTHADALVARVRRVFYDLRIADGCENATADPYPPTACHANACPDVDLTRGHPFSWDTCSPGCGSAFAAHACAPIAADGRDRVHLFATIAAGPLRVTLASEQPGLDAILYDAVSGACVGWADASLEIASLPAGRYALVVDGPAGSEGGYALTWESLP